MRTFSNGIFVAAIALPSLLVLGNSGLAQEQGSSESHPGAPALPGYNIADYGAVGDGEILNTDAFAKTISACAEAGGGTVFVPPGVYVSGPICLQSNTILQYRGRKPERTSCAWSRQQPNPESAVQ
jgi:polygalacturonase